jgi:outer membrane lipopolysaccharide assembly protein LptE/RlpB
LAYYFDNRTEVDASLGEADALEAELRAEFLSRLIRATGYAQPN